MPAPYLISKCERSQRGAILPNRLRVRAFPDADLRDRFLNRQISTDWRECNRPEITGPGVYAQIAGVWVNVKKVAPDLLAHV